MIKKKEKQMNFDNDETIFSTFARKKNTQYKIGCMYT